MVVAIDKSHNINYKANIDLVIENIASFFLPKKPWLKTPSFIVLCPQQLYFIQCVPKTS
jgi:hypothetical protein